MHVYLRGSDVFPELVEGRLLGIKCGLTSRTQPSDFSWPLAGPKRAWGRGRSRLSVCNAQGRWPSPPPAQEGGLLVGLECALGRERRWRGLSWQE